MNTLKGQASVKFPYGVFCQSLKATNLLNLKRLGNTVNYFRHRRTVFNKILRSSTACNLSNEALLNASISKNDFCCVFVLIIQQRSACQIGPHYRL